MRLRTLIPALGLVAATLLAPGVVEASHRHSRSCGHRYDGYDRGSTYGRGYDYSHSYRAPRYAPDYRQGHYYYAPPPVYYRPYYRPSYQPYYRPYARPYCPPRRPHLSFGFRF